MFFSYTVSVVVVSLAIYGLWCFAKDLWDWYLEPKLIRPPSATFLIFVKDLEQEIEDLIRYLIYEIEMADIECDAVVVDCGSSDLTPEILERLAVDVPFLTVVNLPASSVRPVTETLPLCRGTVVHILDLITRMKGNDYLVTVCSLLRQDGREVAVKHEIND